MTNITIRQILEYTGGTWDGDEELLDRCPEDIVTDSRQVIPGSLFLALRGERTDGHKYIPDVLQRGALAVLCEESVPGEPRIVVDDVLAAMRAAALSKRREYKIPFIGVTGSVGKTTAKEMLAAALSGHGAVYKTPGSMNGQIGIPVSLMSLNGSYDAAVIEMGISLWGEMERIARVVRPDMAVFTNIGDAHLEAFHDRPGILRAKSEILVGMSEDAVVFCNGDDDILRSADFGRRKVLFGLGEHCDVRAENVCSPDGLSLECEIVAGERRFPVSTPAYGTYMIYSVLAAAAVSLELGLTDEEIRRGMAAYETVGHRSRVVKTPFCTLIDDCYNANPTSNRAAVESMLRLPGRKVCILGDMREMGENSAALHRELGEFIREHGVDAVFTQGDEAKEITVGAGDIARHYADRASLLADLPNILLPGDVVLVKASHGPHFDDVAEAIEKLL